MVLLKILLTIIVIPVHIVFFIFAWVMRILTYGIGVLLMFLSGVCSAVLGPIAAFMGLGVSIWIIYDIYGLINGTVDFHDFFVLIMCTLIVGIPVILILAFMEFAAGLIIALGEFLTDVAGESWLGFWN